MGTLEACRPRTRIASGNVGRIPTNPRSTQHAARRAEAQSGVEVLDQGEDVTLAVAQWIPPAMAVMVDDQDFFFASAVFQAVRGTLCAVELPRWLQPFQQRGTAHAGLQPFNLRVLLVHRSMLLWGSAGQGGDATLSPLHVLRHVASATAKPARGKGVRSTGAQSATHPCSAAGASGSAVVRDLRMLGTALCCASVCLASLCAKDRHPPARRSLGVGGEGPRPGSGAWGGRLRPSRA